MKRRSLTRLITLLIIWSILPYSIAVASQSYWVRFYGGDGADSISGASPMPNGDLVAVGSTGINGKPQPWVLRVDRYGSVLWSKYYTLEVDAEIRLNEAAIDEDGNVVVVGTLKKEIQGISDSDLFVMKIDEKGNSVWAKTYGLSGLDGGTSIAIEGNAIFVGGYTDVDGTPGLWILRLNPYGNVVWQREYSSVYPSFKYSMATGKGELIAAGSSESGNLIILRVNPISGTVDDALEYVNFSVSDPLLESSGGGITVAAGSNGCLALLNLNEGGECYKVGSAGPVPGGIFSAENGELFVAASVSKKIWLLGLKDDGSVAFSKIYNLSASDVLNGLTGGDGSLILSGDTDRFSSIRNTDGFIVRLPYNGALPGYESEDVEPEVFGVGGYEPTKVSVRTTVTNAVVENLNVHPKDFPQSGILGVTISPNPESLGKKVEIYLDGNLTSVKGGEILLPLTPGSHSVKVAMNGYHLYETSVSIKAGEEIDIKATLIPMTPTGTLRITSTPSGAAVFLNGTFIGLTPLSLNLSAGLYTIRVSKDGYEDYSKSVEIKGGEEVAITAGLNPITRTTATTTPSITTTTTPVGTTTTTTTVRTTTTTQETTSSTAATTTTTSKKGGGICGPGVILLLVPLSRLMRRGR
ncbi:hypothetical protein A3L09_06850 [Thermococcus profundus]|uniref:PEGA domain-containing protein n=1 Tax=Thermococcus profundus TaxID=49899 RepID=A0A2Z2MEC7_THEPR|nr:PEGA domain-containing protein [Thermococcus profundus]ASJ02995.1 hypothetical protein A3L09_06850 [Thermococcus profundus]